MDGRIIPVSSANVLLALRNMGAFVADSVKFSLDFGHVEVLIRYLAGPDQRNVELFQSCSQGLTHETGTLA